MNNRYTYLASIAVFFLATACGGSSSTGSSSSSTAGGTTASVSSLTTVPSLDISNLDFSQTNSSSSASISAVSKALVRSVIKESDSASSDAGKDKGLGHGFNQVGSSSRAGCEANMHKKEMILHSEQAQLDRCYPEAMEKADLITIPSESFAYYKITPPAEDKNSSGSPCDGIPKDHTEEIAACKKGDEGPKGGAIKMRIGRFGRELRVDMCEGDAGLTSEGTYAANGTEYTISATHIGQFNGNTNKSTFTATVDLGTTGSVTDGIVDLGDGLATADAQMVGGSGSGTMHFEAVGDDKSNIVKGLFKGGFTDPNTHLATSFTGKVYSQFGGTSNTGTAKFEFAGAPPPMSLRQMVPFDLPADQLPGFYQTMSMQLGITINASNVATIYLCPNPGFDPENPDAAANRGVPPMVQADATTGCPSVTHTGVESFSITNGTDTVNDVKTVSQVFTIIANSDSTFFTHVNAFDLSSITDDSGTVAFSRNWDCNAETDFTVLDPARLTDTQKATFRTAIESCNELETKAHHNGGMGEYNCNQQQQEGDMHNMAKNGPPPMGNFGGNLDANLDDTRAASTPCSDEIVHQFQHLFINSVDASADTYCLPVHLTVDNKDTVSCTSFTVAGKAATGLNVDMGHGSFTAITYTQPDTTRPATLATLAFTPTHLASCNIVFDLHQASFDKPPEFDPKQSGGDPTARNPGQAGFAPKVCVDQLGEPPTDPTTAKRWFEKCGSICSSNSTNADSCRPQHD